MNLKEIAQMFVHCGTVDPIVFDTMYPGFAKEVDMSNIYEVNGKFTELFKEALEQSIEIN